jgi:hypothetical protein
VGLLTVTDAVAELLPPALVAVKRVRGGISREDLTATRRIDRTHTGFDAYLGPFTRDSPAQRGGLSSLDGGRLQPQSWRSWAR